MKRSNWGIILSLTIALALSACADEKAPDATESVTVSTTKDAAFVESVTEAPEKGGFLGDYTETTAGTETDVPETEVPEIIIAGQTVRQNTTYFSADMSLITDEDIEKLKALPELSSVQVSNMNGADFLKELDGLENLTVTLPPRSCAEYLDFFKELELDVLMLYCADYTDKDYADYVTAMPDTEVFFYSRTKNSGGDGVLQFYTNPEVVPGAPPKNEYALFDRRSLTLFLTNTDKVPVTVDSAEIFRLEEDEWKSAAVIGIDITLGAGEEEIFEVTPDMFDFAPAGKYKAVICWDGRKEERLFFVNDSFSYNAEFAFNEISLFLDDEQTEVFRKAIDALVIDESYASENTPEDMLARLEEAFTPEYAEDYMKNHTGDNGKIIVPDYRSSISFVDWRLSLIYSDDSTVIIRNTSVQQFPDLPFDVWFEERSGRMIKTEDGWRFDCFRLL